MNSDEKLNILRMAECSGLPKAEVLKKFDIPERTYYRWQRRFRLSGRLGLVDINYVTSMLITITLWIAVAPLMAAGRKRRK